MIRFMPHKHAKKKKLTTKEWNRAVLPLRQLSRLLDSSIRIPGTQARIGLDPILGLLPVAGDTVSLVVSGYIILHAWRLDVPKQTVALMVINLLVDWLVGSIPVLGNIFDFVYKANERNLELMGIKPEKP